MTVPGAIQALEKIADQFGDKIVLGAGTVLDPETARACMLAGAQFFVTPSLNLATIEMAKRYSKADLARARSRPPKCSRPGKPAPTPSRYFPAATSAEPKYIKALKGPFPQIEMIPTGGVNLETAGDFLKAGACAVAVGGELIDAKTIKEGKFRGYSRNAPGSIWRPSESPRGNEERGGGGLGLSATL